MWPSSLCHELFSPAHWAHPPPRSKESYWLCTHLKNWICSQGPPKGCTAINFVCVCVCVCTCARTRHEGVWRRGCTDPCFLDLSTRWRWVVSYMPQLFYPPRERAPLPTGEGTGWAPEPVWMLWSWVIIPGLKLWPLGHQACRQLLYWPCARMRARTCTHTHTHTHKF
jgi:hypothetical protein